jgi:hypothetical protein
LGAAAFQKGAGACVVSRVSKKRSGIPRFFLHRLTKREATPFSQKKEKKKKKKKKKLFLGYIDILVY